MLIHATTVAYLSRASALWRTADFEVRPEEGTIVKKSLFFLFLMVTCCLPRALYAQAWSGILAPSRAINWSNAGVVGGIPSGSWPLCTSAQAGTTVPIPAYSGTALTINAAIAACGAANPNGSVLMLGAGTFTFSPNPVSGQDGGITWYENNPVSNVVVRGQGADQTTLVCSTGVCENCNGITAIVCIAGSNSGIGNEQNVCDWTAGYSPGATTITLANCGSTAPAVGSISNLKVGNLIILDQVDYPTDTGTIWICGSGACSISGGPGRTDGPSVNGVSLRSAEQVVTVTQCDGNSTTGHVCSSGTNITISPGLYLPVWTSGQAPQAWYANAYVFNDGIEDVTVSTGDVAAAFNNITVFNAANCWVKGVRSEYAGYSHVEMAAASHISVVNSFLYQNIGHAQESYGAIFVAADDSVFQNNICVQVTDTCPSIEGSSEGNVISYNFTFLTLYTTGSQFFQPMQYFHSSGDAFNLYEGNVSNGVGADAIHGTHHFETFFRNQFTGWQDMCLGAVPCIYNTIPVGLQAGSRYFNMIGNVVGTPGYHTNYQCAAIGNSGTCPTTTNNAAYASHSNYTFGWNDVGGANNPNPSGFCINPACASTVNYDPQTYNYSMRWGNWDAANTAVQWNASEVPSSVSPYGNPVPTACTSTSLGTCPASFYLSSKPSWWGSLSWPGIGPDIRGGNIGQCSGGTYAMTATIAGECTGGTFVSTAFGGFSNMNPAMNCALNVMGMPPDASGSAVSFNEATCYGGQSGPTPPPPTPPPPTPTLNPPTSLTVTVD